MIFGSTPNPKTAAKAPPPSASGRIVQAANTWRQNYNPLRGLDINRAVLLLERERRGDLAEIQWVYEVIDQLDPDMVALISLRAAAIKRLRPDVVCSDPKTSGFDRALADDQAAALRRLIDSLDMVDCVEDLALATFRGFSVQQILRDSTGLPVGLSVLDRWCFARDGYRGAWWWNPAGASTTGRALPERDRIGGPELPASDFIIRHERLAVDRACLCVGIRTSTCEKDWDAWCEMYGLNQAILVEPPNADPKDRPSYDASARAFSDGQGGTIPNGASVTFPQSARNIAPFKDRADYLTRKKVLAGTSGRLTMLAEAGTGNLAGGAHQDTFDALADAESAEICKLVNRTLTADLFARLFPGRPRLASFALVRDAAEDHDANAERIAKVAVHFDVDPADASERTGLKLSAKTQPAAAPSLYASALHSLPPSSLSLPPSSLPSEDALAAAAAAAIVEARRQDLAPVIDRALAALELADPAAQLAALQALYNDLPALLRAAGKDPSAAPLFQRILSDAVGAGWAQASTTRKGTPAK